MPAGVAIQHILYGVFPIGRDSSPFGVRAHFSGFRDKRSATLCSALSSREAKRIQTGSIYLSSSSVVPLRYTGYDPYIYI